MRRRTGGRANCAEPYRRCRSQGSPTAGGEGAAWRAPASGPLQIAPSPLCALLRSAADPKRCSHLRSELRTWKIDTRRARASHWSQPPAGSGLGASNGGGGRGRVLRLSITGHALPRPPPTTAPPIGGAGSLSATQKTWLLPGRFYWLEGRGKLLPATNWNIQWAPWGRREHRPLPQEPIEKRNSEALPEFGVEERWRPPKGVGACASY